jgi:predicted membrane protein
VCTCSPSAHYGRYSVLPSIVPPEVLLCILLGGPYQTLLVVKINTIHSVHLQSTCTLWKVLFFTIYRARRGYPLYSIRRTGPMMVKINTIHCVHLQSKCTLWKIVFLSSIGEHSFLYHFCII